MLGRKVLEKKLFSLWGKEETSLKTIQNSLVCMLSLNSFIYFHYSGQTRRTTNLNQQSISYILNLGSDDKLIECYCVFFFFLVVVFLFFLKTYLLIICS